MSPDDAAVVHVVTELLTESSLDREPALELRGSVVARAADGNARDRLMKPTLVLADIGGLAVAGVIAAAAAGTSDALVSLALFTLLAIAIAGPSGLYARDEVVLRTGTLDEYPQLVQGLTFAGALSILVGQGLLDVRTGLVALTCAVACVTVPVARRAARATVRRATGNERVLILGSGLIADLIASKIAAHPELGLEVVGCLDVDGEGAYGQRPSVAVLGDLADVERIAVDQRVDRVVIAFSAGHHDSMLDAIRRCTRLQLKILVVPRLFEVIGSRVELDHIEGLTLLGLRGPRRTRGAIAAKRAMDIVGSVAALVVFSPLFVILAVLIKLTSPGPVLFRQERIGRDQMPFSMYKFRTMVVDAEARKRDIAHLNEIASGPMFKIDRDPRVTPIGRFLRATSIDEIPQFINVLRGEMSVVGPRPLIREENDAMLGWHRTRLEITPGLTGPWQVMGRQQLPFEEMVKLDYLYVAEWSLWNDIKLALRTIPVMYGRTGA